MIPDDHFLPGKNYGIAASLRKPWEKKENKSPAATPDEYLTWAIFARWIFGLRIIITALLSSIQKIFMVRLSNLVEYVIFKCHLTPSNQINSDIICRMVPPSPYYRYILSDICAPGIFSANCGQSAMLLTNLMSTGFHSGSVKLQITNCKFQITKEPPSPRAQCRLGSELFDHF